MQESEEQKSRPRLNRGGLLIGAAAGLGVGVALDDWIAAIAMGAGLAVVFGMAMCER